MRREPGLDGLLQRFGELVGGCGARARHDEGLHDLAAQVVGDPHDCGLGDVGVGQQHALDLVRADPVPGHEDHVVITR